MALATPVADLELAGEPPAEEEFKANPDQQGRYELWRRVSLAADRPRTAPHSGDPW